MPNDLESTKQDIGASIAEQVMLPMSARNAGITALLEQAREDSFTLKVAKHGNQFDITKSVGGKDEESTTMTSSAQEAQIGVHFNSNVLDFSASINSLSVDKTNSPVSRDVFKAKVSAELDSKKQFLEGPPKDVTLKFDEVVDSPSKGLLFAQNAECKVPVDGDWLDVSKDKLSCKGTITDTHSQEYQFTTEANLLATKTVITSGDKTVGVVTTTHDVDPDSGTQTYNVKIKPGADDGK